MALALVARQNLIVLTYGDMMRVPGSDGNSLAKMRGEGARVQVVTSAMQSIKIARNNPGSEVVFLGVGFETTAPATAVTLKCAKSEGLRNFSVLCFHKTVPPVMRVLCSNPDLKVDGFVLPGNVTVVAGVQDYVFLTEELHKAAAVAGFEPAEILAALVDLSHQVATGCFKLSAYRLKDVPREGNQAALKILSEVFEPCDALWRGLGTIQGSGLRISGAHLGFDAIEKFGMTPSAPAEIKGCRCGEVLAGLATPPDCQLYGGLCTPLNPVGPCMVSSEGTCGAWYRFNR
jgi:hydrogenase expression/formation protein HypD